MAFAIGIAMSGLAGITSAAPVSPAFLDQQISSVVAALAHRGTARALSASAHARLFQFARSAQPVPAGAHNSAGVTVLWHGRLDNATELARELGVAGNPALSAQDLIGAAWQKWRFELPARLLGDFALAIWDEPRCLLFAARDVFGLRPFFYTELNGCCAFASEARALAAAPGADTTPDDAMVADFLLPWSSYPALERTFFRGIRRLPRGHALCWNAAGLRTWSYWQLDAARRIALRRPDDYREQFLERLQRAVQRRVPRSGRAAVFLSGGFDSGAVAACAARGHGGGNVLAITGRAVEADDETQLSREVAQHCGIAQRVLDLTPAGYGAWVEPLIARQASPIIDRGLHNFRALLAAARDGGCAVALTGDAADALFGSPTFYLADMVRTGRWLALARALPQLAAYNAYGTAEMLRRALPELVPRAVRTAFRYAKWRRLPEWIAPDFAMRAGLRERLRHAPVPQALRSISATWDFFSCVSGRRAWTEESREMEAARAGVDLAMPFFDRELVEFMFAVPWEMKWRGWRNKVFLRDAPGLLPESLRNSRRKGSAGITVPPDPRALQWAKEVLGQQRRDDAFVDADSCARLLRGEPLRLRAAPDVIVWLLARFFLWLGAVAPR